MSAFVQTVFMRHIGEPIVGLAKHAGLVYFALTGTSRTIFTRRSAIERILVASTLAALAFAVIVAFFAVLGYAALCAIQATARTADVFALARAFATGALSFFGSTAHLLILVVVTAEVVAFAE